MGKLSRTKGHSFERYIAVLLRKVFPDARRHLENHEDDANGVDLMGTGKYKIQCKRGRKAAPISKIKEVQCGPDDVPVLVTQGDRDQTYAVIPFEEFVRLCQKDV